MSHHESDEAGYTYSMVRYNDQVANQLITQMQDMHLARLQHWKTVNEQSAAFAASQLLCPRCENSRARCVCNSE